MMQETIAQFMLVEPPTVIFFLTSFFTNRIPREATRVRHTPRFSANPIHCLRSKFASGHALKNMCFGLGNFDILRSQGIQTIDIIYFLFSMLCFVDIYIYIYFCIDMCMYICFGIYIYLMFPCTTSIISNTSTASTTTTQPPPSALLEPIAGSE